MRLQREQEKKELEEAERQEKLDNENNAAIQQNEALALLQQKINNLNVIRDNDCPQQEPTLRPINQDGSGAQPQDIM